jgi:glycosyltransferase involved in cell wall biosynthesis
MSICGTKTAYRCLVILPSFQDMGGGPKVMGTMMDELSRQGFEVCALAIDGFPREKFKQYWEINLDNVRAYSIVRRKLAKDTVFLLHPLLFLISICYLRRLKPNLVIYSDDVIGAIFPFLGKESRVLLYVHFPLGIKIREDIFLDKPRSFPGKAIFPLKKQLMKLFLGKYSRKANVIVCNSSLTPSYVERAWQRNDIKIIFPPVDTDKFEPLEKEADSIAIVGGIYSGKRPDFVIKALKKCKTRPILHIVGITGRDPQYIDSLKILIKDLGLEQQVLLHPDASFEELKQVVGQSRAIISACEGEAFGIAVVEGMASGCVPIVLRSGGPWDDVIEHGRYGFGYSTDDELAERIDAVLSDEGLFKEYSVAAQGRAKHFSDAEFRAKITEVARGLLEGCSEAV